MTGASSQERVYRGGTFVMQVIAVIFALLGVDMAQSNAILGLLVWGVGAALFVDSSKYLFGGAQA